MGVREQHPEFIENVIDMIVVRDNFEGQRRIKEKSTDYLPATEGHMVDGKGTSVASPTAESVQSDRTLSKGDRDYKSYKRRAIFYDFVKEGVEKAVGMMHRKPATIELPSQMEDLREKATPNNESLQDLLMNIHVDQLIEGRVGLLADIAPGNEGRDTLPYIAMYNGQVITNWDNGLDEELTVGSLNLVVLNETSFERQDDFSWEIEEKYRVLILGESEPNEGANTASTYRVAVIQPEKDDTSSLSSISETQLIEPSIRGNTLNEIPFVFINSKDLNPAIDKPPFLGLADLSLAIYRGEADYNQSLYMQGQDTFVITGKTQNPKQRGDKSETRVGAGSVLELAADAKAEYVGVQSQGLSEQRLALEGNKKRADAKAGQTINLDSMAAESNDALETRIGAGTATLTQIAITGAKGLENSLKQIARWMGLNENEVIVTPNLDFDDVKLAGAELESFMKAKLLGAPLSMESIHKFMKDRELTTMDFEDEMDLIDEEIVEVIPTKKPAKPLATE